MMMAFFIGCIYADEPANDFFKLSHDERERMSPALAGLPVLVEHDKSICVGRVENSWVDDRGYMFIVARLSGSPSARAVGNMLKKGQPMALKHARHGDGRLEPLEVSIVSSAARPNAQVVEVCKPSSLL